MHSARYALSTCSRCTDWHMSWYRCRRFLRSLVVSSPDALVNSSPCMPNDLAGDLFQDMFIN